MPAVGVQREGLRLLDAAVAPDQLPGDNIVGDDHRIVGAPHQELRPVGGEDDAARPGAGLDRLDHLVAGA